MLEAKWTGACKPDQKPGDIILPNGGKINVATKAADQKQKAPRDNPQRKRSGYVPSQDAGALSTPVPPPPGTTTK